MASESLAQFARQRNAEKIAARKRTMGAGGSEEVPPVVDQSVVADSIVEEVAKLQESTIEETQAEPRGQKRLAESSEVTVESMEQPTNKRPRVFPSLDLATPFTIQPRIKGALVPTGASASKDPSVALSVALVIAFPADKASFSAKPNVISIALAAQSAILAVEQISEIGCHHYDAVELIGSLKVVVEIEKMKTKSAIADLAVATKKAEAEAMRADEEHAKAVAEEGEKKHVDLLRRAAEERASITDAALAMVKKEIEKLKVDLQVANKAKEQAQSEQFKAFDVGEMSTMEKYADEALKFENRGFKHGWLKALAAAKVMLDVPIPYEQL